MTHATDNRLVMPERLSLRQVLCTPLSLRANAVFENAQRAYRLMRRWDSAVAKLRRKLHRLSRAVISAGVDRASPAQFVELAAAREQLSLLESLTPNSGRTCQLVLSSEMLCKSFEYCIQDEREGLHFIVGIEHDGLKIGTELRTFPYAARTVVSAEGEFSATHRIAIEMHETGHCIVGMFHSHPGRGPTANEPSGTDLRTQRLMERTLRFVSGIWARDGNLRLYGSAADDLGIVGTHLEKRDDGTWQLVSPSDETPDVEDAALALAR